MSEALRCRVERQREHAALGAWLLDRQQHDWHHAVPRERSASGARMSITLRHSWPAGR